MSKPKHSCQGYLRSLQMSRNKLFVFVEGKECDPYFYGKICNIVCSNINVEYQVRLAKELPSASGGKASLIEFYRYLKNKSSLLASFNGKKTGVIFFLDKDIDDILRRKCRSMHVVYTEYYDVQNHIFKAGNLIEGISAAASIDTNLIKRHPMFSHDWCKHAASRWEEWVKLCIMSQKYSIRTACNYRSTSAINKPLNKAIDPALLAAKQLEMKAKYICSKTPYDKGFKAVKQIVDKHYRHNTQDIIFKGKWYTTLIELDVKDAFSGRPFHYEKLGQRITSSLVLTLDFGQSWADIFKVPILSIASQL